MKYAALCPEFEYMCFLGMICSSYRWMVSSLLFLSNQSPVTSDSAGLLCLTKRQNECWLVNMASWGDVCVSKRWWQPAGHDPCDENRGRLIYFNVELGECGPAFLGEIWRGLHTWGFIGCFELLRVLCLLMCFWRWLESQIKCCCCIKRKKISMLGGSNVKKTLLLGGCRGNVGTCIGQNGCAKPMFSKMCFRWNDWVIVSVLSSCC